MNIITQFFKNNLSRNKTAAQLDNDLIRIEAKVNEKLFGPQPNGGKREFFCLDEHTWIWYEEWVDDAGDRHKVTTRYVVRPTEIVKSQNGGAYHRLTLAEADNFKQAVDTYTETSQRQIYRKFAAAQQS